MPCSTGKWWCKKISLSEAEDSEDLLMINKFRKIEGHQNVKSKLRNVDFISLESIKERNSQAYGIKPEIHYYMKLHSLIMKWIIRSGRYIKIPL